MNHSRSGRSDCSDELVVTVHGLLAGPRCMLSLENRLHAADYRVAHFAYPSLRGSLLGHANALRAMLCDLVQRVDVSKIHLVTHSMGGIIARLAVAQTALEKRWPEKCGRVVMMAPPNRGSWLTRLPLGPFAHTFPQLTELSEKPGSLVRSLPRMTQFRVGVIAAAHDWIVQSCATHLPEQRDHACLPTSHQRLVRDNAALNMVVQFLQHERFEIAWQPNLTTRLPKLVPDQRRRVQSSLA